MPKQTPAGQFNLFEVEEYLKTAPCVPLLRQKVGGVARGAAIPARPR